MVEVLAVTGVITIALVIFLVVEYAIKSSDGKWPW